MKKPSTGNGRDDGQKPQMKESFFRERDGGVRWDETPLIFPLGKENERKIAREREQEEGR
jgi:hypothetical protein